MEEMASPKPMRVARHGRRMRRVERQARSRVPPPNAARCLGNVGPIAGPRVCFVARRTVSSTNAALRRVEARSAPVFSCFAADPDVSKRAMAFITSRGMNVPRCVERRRLLSHHFVVSTHRTWFPRRNCAAFAVAMDVPKGDGTSRASGNTTRRPPKERRDANAWKEKVRVGKAVERTKRRGGR